MKKAKETDIKDLDKSELVDICDVKIDRKKPYLIRIISYTQHGCEEESSRTRDSADVPLWIYI